MLIGIVVVIVVYVFVWLSEEEFNIRKKKLIYNKRI